MKLEASTLRLQRATESDRQRYLYIHLPLSSTHHACTLMSRETRDTEPATETEENSSSSSSRERLSDKRTRLKAVHITARYNEHTQCAAVADPDPECSHQHWIKYFVRVFQLQNTDYFLKSIRNTFSNYF